MTENRKTPKLRFKGFTDAWEQRKLYEVLSSYTDPVEIPRTGYERLGIRSHAKGTFHNFVPAGHELQTAQMHRVAADKFIVNITFGWEHAVAVTDENDAGKLVSHRFPQFSLSEELDPKFLKFIILDEDFRHHLWLASPGGAGRNRVLNINEMLQYEIMIPNVPEQRKIARLLIDLDNLITLHQRKLERLKNVKKSMLDKMFPKDGEVVPEIRFKGFTDAWEQRKLESLFTKYEDKVKTPNSGYWRLGLRSHCKGTFHTYVDAGNELETAEMNRVQSGNFILNITFAWERALAVTNEEDQDKLVSHRFPQFKPNRDLAIDFFKHTLMDKRFKHHLELSSPGGAGRNKVLKIADMLKYELLVPSMKEQNEISSFLNNVDYIITLHQRKLEHLQLQKKALLQQMFV